MALLAAQFGLVLAAVLPQTKQFSNYNCFLVEVPWSKNKEGNKKCITEELFLHPQMPRLQHMSVISLVESIFNDNEPMGITRNKPNTHLCKCTRLQIQISSLMVHYQEVERKWHWGRPPVCNAEGGKNLGPAVIVLLSSRPLCST